MARPFCVVLTGGLASGKSTVAHLFAAEGIAVVDTDHLARLMTAPDSPVLKRIVESFGEDILKEGVLDRRTLRQRIFTDDTARAQLETILHPVIFEAARLAVSQATEPYVLLVVPLLTETWPLFKPLADRILVVDCAEPTQIQRACIRDDMPPELARAMLNRQSSRADRLGLADDIILNDSTTDELATYVSALHARYLAYAENRAHPVQ